MNYTYKKIKNFATLLSKELGLQMRIHKEGKTLVYFLSEWLDLYPFAWVDINIGTYDKWMQELHMSREIHGEGDWYALSDFSEEKQAMVRDARRKGEPVVWIEMAIRTMRHKRHEARCALIKGSECEFGDDDFNYIKEWLEERRANVASEDVAALKIVNSRGFDYPHYDKQSETISVQKNGKLGLLDKKGEIIFEPLYDNIRPLRNGNVIVCKEKSWSLINRQGDILKNLEYDTVREFVDGFAVVTLGGKYGIIDESGNLLGELKYDKIRLLVSESRYGEEDKFAEYFEACIDGKWGFLNKQGKEMSPFVYDEIHMRYDFEGGFVRVCKNGKWGYVNDKCEEMCEFVYEFDWRDFLRLGDKLYKPNADGVLEEYKKKPVDDNDLPF
ncbi:MAG: WG repeat-containing protein [Muribaculaceae bacterium]|nr:WG repeat-containing protein [Muribaculaceae bacterium]MBR5770450.1 WG repeat-containing protein [Alistipes sp.]